MTTNTNPVENRKSPRYSTVVWGLIVTAVGVGAFAWAIGSRFDFTVAAAILLGAGGVTLIVAAIAGAARNSTHKDATPSNSPGTD